MATLREMYSDRFNPNKFVTYLLDNRGVNDPVINRLCEEFDSAEDVAFASLGRLKEVNGVGETTAMKIHNAAAMAGAPSMQDKFGIQQLRDETQGLRRA